MNALFGKTSHKLGKRDAAIVLSEDGKLTLLIPNGEDEEEVGDNVMLASAIAVFLLEDPKMVNLLINTFALKVKADLYG